MGCSPTGGVQVRAGGVSLALPTSLVAVRAPAAAVPVPAAAAGTAAAGTVTTSTPGAARTRRGHLGGDGLALPAQGQRRRARAGDTVRFKRGGDWSGNPEAQGQRHGRRPGSSPSSRTARGRTRGSYRRRIYRLRGDGGLYVRVAGLRASGCRWAGFEVRGTQRAGRRALRPRTSPACSSSAPATRQDERADANNRMSVNDKGGDNDSGAFGVLLNGDDNLVFGT